MSSRFKATSFIANVAVLIGIVLALGFLFDRAAAWLGYEPFAFCALLLPVIFSAQAFAIAVTSAGLIVWVVSMFKSPTGFALTAGGLLIGILPTVLPHYLGTTCAVS